MFNGLGCKLCLSICHFTEQILQLFVLICKAQREWRGLCVNVDYMPNAGREHYLKKGKFSIRDHNM